MSNSRSVESIETELREVESRRLALLEELRERKAKSLLPNPALSFDEREYPDTAEKRVALFEKLFVARADVYPRYWENQKTGRKGYSPACESIWEDGRRLKATEIYARYGVSKFHRLDAAVIEAHLRGQIVVGTYAIRKDDTCIFLAADFDGDGWKRDAAAYRDEASRLGIQTLVEVSRSGNGAHVWILFHEPVAASLVRRLGSLLLARAAACHPGLRLDAYDRFFPNQDTIGIYVYADWQGLGGPTLMGALYRSIVRGEEILSFEYEPAWLRDGKPFVLDPQRGPRRTLAKDRF